MSPARRLLLVRHGLPDYSSHKRGDIFPGPPLSAIGRTQARQAAESLRAFHAAAIHTSPLARTHQTAAEIGRLLRCPIRVDSGLWEWRGTESLFEVSVRLTHWLVSWLRGGERCAVAVSHASPILAVLRSALYLPHVAWHRSGRPDLLELASSDRLEVSMASVFELEITPRYVTARRHFHAHPRLHYQWRGRRCRRPEQPVAGAPENVFLRRPNRLGLVGYRG